MVTGVLDARLVDDADADVGVDILEPRPRLSERVGERVRRPRAATVLADVLVAPFWLVGWLAFWVLAVTGGMVRWMVAAAQLGWEDARAQATARSYGVGRWPVRARGVKRLGPAGGSR